MGYKISELEHRIEFQRFSSVSDGQGGNVITWNTLQSCWAKITPSGSQERVFAQKLQDDYDHEIIIRNTLDHAVQQASDRIQFGSRIFQIKTIQYTDNRKWWIKLKVKEGVAS